MLIEKRKATQGACANDRVRIQGFFFLYVGKLLCSDTAAGGGTRPYAWFAQAKNPRCSITVTYKCRVQVSREQVPLTPGRSGRLVGSPAFHSEGYSQPYYRQKRGARGTRRATISGPVSDRRLTAPSQSPTGQRSWGTQVVSATTSAAGTTTA